MDWASTPTDQVVCRRCRRPLDVHHQRGEDEGEHVVWMHTLWDLMNPGPGPEHEPDPVLAAESGGGVVGICDFCAQPGARWAYPCDSFVLEGYGSEGPWAACERCHGLLEEGDSRGLVAAALEQVPAAQRSLVRHKIALLHKSFRHHRREMPKPLW